MEEGKSTPPGIDPKEMYPIYSMTVLTRRPIDEVLEELTEAEDDEDMEYILTYRKED